MALNEVGDRGFVTYGPEHEQAERAFVAETEHLLRSHAVRHVHADLSAARFLCETAHERGATLSAEAYDAGAWLASPEVHDLLTRVDLVFVNEHEALAMAGAQSLERAAAELAARCAHVVVKRGAEGAIAYVHGQAVHAAVTPVDVVDATGAGDCFAAGYLWGFLGGRSPADCLALGNVCGRGAVATLGGYQGAPTLAELLPTARAAGVALA